MFRPSINKVKKVEHLNKEFYVKGRNITALFEIFSFDSEQCNSFEVYDALMQLLLSEGNLSFKFFYSENRSTEENDDFDLNIEELRPGAYASFPIHKRRIFLSVTRTVKGFDLISSLDTNKLITRFEEVLNEELLETKFLAKRSKIGLLPKIFHIEEKLSRVDRAVYFDNNYYGIVRLTKLKSNIIDIDTFSHLKLFFGDDFWLTTQVESTNNSKAMYSLKRSISLNDSRKEHYSEKKNEELKAVYDSVENGRDKYVQFETLVLVRDPIYSSLEKKLKKVYNKMSNLGLAEIENLGLNQSLQAMQFMNPIHVGIREVCSQVPAYLPIFSNGDRKPLHQAKIGSLVISREDNTPTSISVSNQPSANKNFGVFGKTGTGKSFCTGMMIEACMKGPDQEMMLLDIGNSHSKTVKACNGVERVFDFKNPSGLNPFKYAGDDSIDPKKKALALQKFVECLITENDEKDLTIEMKSVLAQSIMEFVTTCKVENAQIEDFLKVEGIPRKNILKRYTLGSMYENVFRSVKEDVHSSFEYFNIKDALDSSDIEIVKSVAAGVFNQFHMRTILNPNKKISMFIDEVQIILKAVFPYACFMAKNIRKIGGLGISSQCASDLVIGGDHTLLDQLENKYFFKVGEGSKPFLTDLDYMKNQSLSMNEDNYSEFMHIVGGSSRTCFLHSTLNDFWTKTTSPDEKAIISNMMSGHKYKEQDILECIMFLESQRRARL